MSFALYKPYTYIKGTRLAYGRLKVQKEEGGGEVHEKYRVHVLYCTVHVFVALLLASDKNAKRIFIDLFIDLFNCAVRAVSLACLV